MERIGSWGFQYLDLLRLHAWFNRLRATVDPFWWPLYPPNDSEPALD